MQSVRNIIFPERGGFKKFQKTEFVRKNVVFGELEECVNDKDKL